MTILEKSKFIGSVFICGVQTQLRQEWTWGAAAVTGLHQGFKYKGSIKTGVVAGVAVLTVLAVANGACNVISHWDRIKEVCKE